MRHLSKILPIIFLILSTEMLHGGTDGTIRGKVTDEESLGLPGSTIDLPELGGSKKIKEQFGKVLTLIDY